MAEEMAVVTDSASVAETAPSEVAVEQTDVTHGDTTEQATPTDETAAPAEETPTEDDGDEDEESDEHQTEEEKTKAQKRRERRQAKEAERIASAVQAEVERRDREREVKAHQEFAEKQTKEAQAAWLKEFGELVGTPEARAQLDQEIAALTREAAQMRPYADGTDLDVLEQKQAALEEKIAQRDRLNENQKTYDKIDAYQFANTQGAYAALAERIPADHAKLLLQSTDVPTALTRFEAGVVAREAAKHAADKAAAVKTVTADLEKERAAHAATRTGGPGAGPVPATGGTASTSGRIYTRERLAQRVLTSEGRAEYRANKNEIERQERAGLIR